MKIADLNISARAKSCLLRAGYLDIEELEGISDDTLLEIKNFNYACIDELREAMNDLQLRNGESTKTRIHQLATNKEFMIAKNIMIESESNSARNQFYNLFANMIGNSAWISAPVNDKHLKCKRDGGELKGGLGKYGPYVRCNCGHFLKPDEI